MRKTVSPLRLVPLAAALGLAFAGAAPAQTLPQGEALRAGSATVARPAPGRMEIHQTSDRAVIEWTGFSIGQGGTVALTQPSAGAWLLSRVVGTDPSVIAGAISANGGFALVNPNGVLFTSTARLDVGSLIAATANISNENFMNGRMSFDEVINRGASVINRGEINAAEGGLVALVAPGVANAGTIRATLGRVALASGHAFTLDLFGDQLVSFAVGARVSERVLDTDGRPLRAYVDHSGAISAESVQISANAARAVLDEVVNMSGVIRAAGAAQRGGAVVLTGEDIHVTASGRIDVSGEQGGSAVLIADNHMRYEGVVDARGSAGPGGFVEVSGKNTLAYHGDVLMSAGGQLLFDPTELTIDAAMATTLGNAMRAGANATATTSSGDLLVASPIYGQGGANGGLTLTAGGSGSVIVDAVIVAGGPVTFNGVTEFRRSVFTNVGNITLNGLGIINPRGDEIGFNPTGTGSSEVPYSTASLEASGIGPSRTTTSGGTTFAWDALTLKITIATGAGDIVVNNGLVHFADPLANRAAVSSVRWYNGIDVTAVTPARSALTPTAVGWVGVNLVGNTVSLNGPIGYSAGQIADYSASVAASPDTTFKILAVGSALAGAPQAGSEVTKLRLNDADVNPYGTLTVTNSDPNHNGQLVPPSPTSASIGNPNTYIAELGLSAGAGGAASASNSVLQEANSAGDDLPEGPDGSSRGAAQEADLGRGGAAADVFALSFQLVDGRDAGSAADQEYFEESPFETARRRSR